ncbi:MAG: TetR/AcrR family transcriptional regulator C-terminal domain-containing protein [Oscillospiraceae bacterium]|nr:TetR/AcrR family transcriptional regulator C-terminal domain-containing protein [Oscillospiraceae bacterium]
MKHTDTRIKVTKALFHRALLDILKDKPIDQVSVKELVEAAELNRSTFYLHYSSPLDVLKEIENQFVEEKLVKFDSYWTGAMDQGRMAAIISIVLEDKDLCRILMSEHGDPQFLISLKHLVKDGVVDGWKKDHPRISKEKLLFLYDYVFSGSTQLILSWIRDPQGVSPEEFSKLLENLGHHALLAAERL